MSDPTDYLLLFRGTDWGDSLPPEKARQVVTDWYSWFDQLVADGKALGGHPLHNTGKVISGRGGRRVVDGPFAEAKEAVGGYFYLRVADEDEAIRIAQRCPGLEHGAVVEIRPVAEVCQLRDQVERGCPTAAVAVLG